MILSRRDLIRAIAATVCVSCMPRLAWGGERNDHDKLLAKLMFGSETLANKSHTGFTDTEYRSFELLCAASYLCVDQFNNKGQDDLEKLKNEKVPGLPGSISDIDYSAGGVDHRRYTHRGWDYIHQSSKVKDWAKRWETRKSILRNTVAKVFNLRDSFLFFNLGYKDSLEPLCECIYLIHILEDHLVKKAYLLPATILPLAIAHPTESGEGSDILTRLQFVGSQLFKEGQSSSGFKAGLDSHAICLRRLVGSEGGVNTEQKESEYKEACRNLEDYLCAQIPTLFRQIDFIKAVFGTL